MDYLKETKEKLRGDLFTANQRIKNLEAANRAYSLAAGDDKKRVKELKDGIHSALARLAFNHTPEEARVGLHILKKLVMDIPAKDGVCCDCGYSGEDETPCTAREDRTHCVHWWG